MDRTTPYPQRNDGAEQSGAPLKRLRLKGLILAALLFLTSQSLFSHPHMFIDSRVEVVANQEGLQGFRVEWLFDKFFTAQILLDYDADQNSSFDSEEVEAIEAGAFNNLVNYNYFTTVEAGGKRKAITRVNQFDAFLVDKRLGYRFFIPLEVPLPSREGSREQVRLSIFDHTFFCDIASTRERPVVIHSPDSIAIDWNIRRNTEDPIVYDPMTGSARRDGVTYTGMVYPEEISLVLVRR